MSDGGQRLNQLDHSRATQRAHFVDPRTSCLDDRDFCNPVCLNAPGLAAQRNIHAAVLGLRVVTSESALVSIWLS